MTTTDDLRSALAEIDRQAAEMGVDASNGADTDNAASDAAERQVSAVAAANEEAAIVAALSPLVDVAMDATIGRFQVAQQNPRAVPEFLALARAELTTILRNGSTVVNAVTRDRRRGAPGSPTRDESVPVPSGIAEGSSDHDQASSRENAATAQERDLLRSERDRLQASENFLRTVGSEMVGDLTVRTQQVQALQGVVRRRDALLGEQRKAYLRELCHLRTIIKQWETKGFATTNDAGFFNWGDDDLADRIGADTAQEAADIAAEERARFDKELDSERQRSAKVEEGLRRQVAVLEQQLRQAAMSAPPPMTDQETITEELVPLLADANDAWVQTDDVFVAEQAPPAGIEEGQDLTDASPVNIDHGTHCVGCPVCASHFKISGMPSHVQESTSPKRASKAGSRRRSSARPPSGGSTRTEAQATAHPTASVSAPSPASAAATGVDADVAMLRAELEEQQRQQRILMSRLQGKEDTLASAAATKLENDEARRRAESQTIRKLHDEVRAKDALLEKKSRELSQLQEEAKRWFAQYQESLPADHAPVNHAALRRMTDAVSRAEAAEEVYRLESWELLALNVKARTVLQGLHDDCRAAEGHGDTAGLRMCQRAYDCVGHQMRQRCARARQRRVRLREEANRIWDVVLYYARSVHHVQEPMPPPPRYYSVDNHGEAGPASLPPSPMRRRAEIESVMLNHSAAAERANAGRHQVLKLGPVVVDPPRDAKASPRGRPGTAPTQRASADLQSPFVHKIRDEVSAEKAARAPARPSAVSAGATAAESRPRRSGAAPRPQTAGLARKHGFNPAELAGQPLAARRAALVKLMRHDQDTLAVSKQRHIDGVYRSRATRNQAPRFRPQSGAESTDAELFATPGLTQQRLLGRHEAANGDS